MSIVQIFGVTVGAFMAASFLAIAGLFGVVWVATRRARRLQRAEAMLRHPSNTGVVPLSARPVHPTRNTYVAWRESRHLDAEYTTLLLFNDLEKELRNQERDADE